MPKEEPVSMTRQTIYAMIPILNIYAAYKIRRLFRYILIMWIMVGIPIGLIGGIFFPYDENFEVIADDGFGFYDTNEIIFIIVSNVGVTLLGIYLIRRWSAQWNARMLSEL